MMAFAEPGTIGTDRPQPTRPRRDYTDLAALLVDVASMRALKYLTLGMLFAAAYTLIWRPDWRGLVALGVFAAISAPVFWRREA